LFANNLGRIKRGLVESDPVLNPDDRISGVVVREVDRSDESPICDVILGPINCGV